MNIFSVTFPISIYILLFGFCLGIGLSLLFFSIVSIVIVLILLYIGSFRVMPIIDMINSILLFLFPKSLKTIETNIRKSFPVYYSSEYEKNKQYIYCFHPHGVFTVSHYLHIGTNFTDWSDNNCKGTALHILWQLPFGKEIVETYHFVKSHYDDMKQVLLKKQSLSVTLGGVKEIALSQNNKMTLNIGKKRGIFKMAIETGTPIVPVVVYGENEIYELYHFSILEYINKILLSFNLFLPIPTIKSCMRWLSLYQMPLDNPVETHVGKPISVEKIEHPTEENIIALRERYISELKELYDNTRPDYYDKELYIV